METTEKISKREGSANGHRFRFDGFEIDPRNRLLQREGANIPIPAKVFDVLLVFAENPGRLLEKDELIERVWQEGFVEEGNLARHVSTLRKALGDNDRERKYIVTVQGRGYRFVADVLTTESNDISRVPENSSSPPQILAKPVPITPRRSLRRWFWAIPVAGMLIGVFWIIKGRFIRPPARITSLAVLPLKSLDAGENYLGAGIADGVIRRISQTGKLTVRPTSAVIHYLKEDKDALTAARELHTDAVLEGSVQRAEDRLRVSVNLLRSGDGKSLWADSFDVHGTDAFLIQDEVSREVVKRLQLQLDSEQRAGLEKRHTSSSTAYDFYLKGVYNLDLRGYGETDMPRMDDTIFFFKKAIEADPDYALARAQLGYAYAWTALFIEASEPKWAALAKEEIARAQEIDSSVSEAHVANALLLWSGYDGFQNEAAIRELLLAQQLNPSVGHEDLAAIYQHLGLKNLAAREIQQAFDIDPTSQSTSELILILPHLTGDYDDWLAARDRVNPGGPLSVWYLLGKRRLDEAAKAIERNLEKTPSDPNVVSEEALLLALRGDFRAAEKEIPRIASQPINDLTRHHSTYKIACIYALAGKSGEAVKWLNETASTGFPNYPLFEHDSYLDRIRQTPAFIQFMTAEKVNWEHYRQEFGD